MNNIVYIYKLLGDDKQVRYIGKTTNLKRRLSSHISEAKKNKGKRHILNWIFSILNENKKPIMEIVEICNELNWEEKEKYWIKYYKSIYKNLCNISEGGKGGSGCRNFSDEEINRRRQRMSSMFSKHSLEEKEEIWNMIKLNICFNEIKKLFPNFSQQMYSGVVNGKQWNNITGLPKNKLPIRRRGYTKTINNLYIVRRKEGNKLKVEFSSRNEEEVINYLKNK